MLPQVLVKNGDSRRLQVVLAVLFVALSVPTGAVIWQAWSRLKWEAFHQYRTRAEELARRIDSGIGERLAAAGRLLSYPYDGFWACMDTFKDWKTLGEEMGFLHVESGPLVRSSYHARAQVEELRARAGVA